jgi:hypothetical protein
MIKYFMSWVIFDTIDQTTFITLKIRKTSLFKNKVKLLIRLILNLPYILTESDDTLPANKNISRRLLLWINRIF